jgi:hypothetical protein
VTGRLLAAALVAALVAPAGAAVLCKKKTGAAFVRDACKAKEQAVDPVALGLVGAKGNQGDKGDKGDTGPAGPLVTTLPAGATLRGAFAVGGVAPGAGDVASSPISFAFPLATSPTIVVVQKNAPTPAGCTGDAATPGATPGYLCVFVSEVGNNEQDFAATAAGAGTAADYGAFVTVFSVAAGAFGGSGTWAVTAP